MTEPTAEVWQASGRVYITLKNLTWAEISAGKTVETHIACDYNQMRALVDQIVEGFAKLEKPKGEGA